MTFGPSDNERGRDRGREEPYAATGRGGAGNMIRSPSRGRPAEERGETAAQQAYAEKQTVISSGRGGVGNVRSPSRGPADRARAHELDKQEREIQAAALRKDEMGPHATGRGGVGNVKREHSSDARGRDSGVGSAIRSLSRSRSRDTRSASRPPRDSVQGTSLEAVDEKASSHGSEEGTEAHKQGLFSKIAAHLPGHHSHQT